MVRPVRELKAFGRVVLAPGESARVEFVVPVDMLCFTGSDGERVVEPGELRGADRGLERGSSALRATGPGSTGPARTLGRAWRMDEPLRRRGLR